MNPEDECYVMEVNGNEVYVDNGEVDYEVMNSDRQEQQDNSEDREEFEEFIEEITKMEDEK